VKKSPEQGRLDLFRKLDFAVVSFRQSLALCEHLMELNINPTSDRADLYSACMTGIVVTYTLPFGENNLLGSLDDKYRSGFPTVEMTETHKGLLYYRDSTYAHRDLLKSKFTAEGDARPDVHTSRIKIEVARNGRGASISSIPILPDIQTDSLPLIADLLRFQIKRINIAAASLLEHMAAGKSYMPGVYTVGVDFP
jgi:hypothetical protein